MVEPMMQLTEPRHDPIGHATRALAKRLQSRRRSERLIGALVLTLLLSAAMLLLYGAGISLWTTVAVAFDVSADRYKDFQQAYVLSRSIMAGDDPYQPMNVLVSRYAPGTPTLFTHPTPHPPTLGLLALPLSFLSFDAALRVWTLIQLASLVGAVYLLSKSVAIRLPGYIIPAVAMIVALWQPVRSDIYLGNVNTVLLVLLAGLQLALVSGRGKLAGFLLGVSLLVKPICWPVLLLLAIWRRLDAFAASVLTLVTGYSMSMVVIGPSRLWTYLTDVVPAVTQTYGQSPWSFSLPSLGVRVVKGTGADASLPIQQNWLTAPPIAQVPYGEYGFSAVTSVALLVGSSFVVLRWLNGDVRASLGLMLCVSVLISPIAWHHYLVILLIPIIYALDWFLSYRVSAAEALLGAIASLLLGTSHWDWMLLTYRAAGYEPVPFAVGSITLPFPPAHLSFAPSLLTFGPLLAVMTLAALVVILYRSGNSVRSRR